MASARTTPLRPAAKKFVLDSRVVVPAPGGRLRAVPVAPTVSAKAMRVPPWRAPPTVRRSSRMASSATTRSGLVSMKRMPRSVDRVPFCMASTAAGPMSMVSSCVRSERLVDLEQLLVLGHPVAVGTEGGEPGLERWILPAPGDPRRHVDDAEGAQRLAEGQGGPVELAEQLVALQDLVAGPPRFLGVTAGEQPEVLHGRSRHEVVEIHQDRPVDAPQDVADVEVAVDALRPRGGQRRGHRLADAERDVAVARGQRGRNEAAGGEN